MRYVAKVHVLDVMEEVVVSGYVFDADPLTDPDHNVTEFSYTCPGRGVSDPMEWLFTSLYHALAFERGKAPTRRGRGSSDGGTHTISEVGHGTQGGVG
jgi:hypothetical protein